MTSEQADIVISWFDYLTERTNYQACLAAAVKDGYTEKEIDAALKALGELAGRDCGLL